MSLNDPLRPPASHTAVSQPDDAVIWLHSALCSMALPVRATRGTWQRDIEGASLRVEPGSANDMVPSGRVLRLSMMHICDAAFRANNPVVELGHDGTALAAVLGIDPYTRELDDQWQRLQAARISLSEGGRPEISVFDARSRRRAGDISWRSGVRLSTKFLTSLVDRAVPLDRNAVLELSDTPAALDAYAWIRMSLHFAVVDQVLTMPWDDVLARFGTPSQNIAEFRSTFEATLRRVFEVESSVDLAVDDDGVSVRRAEPIGSGDSEWPATQAQEADDTTAPSADKPPEGRAAPTSVREVTAAAENTATAVLCAQKTPALPEPRADRLADTDAGAADQITEDRISLGGHLTGLAQIVWLRRGPGEERVLVGVTPTQRFDAERLTILAVEPMVIQVSGGLNDKDFQRVSAWIMTNRDVIDEFWEGGITSFEEVNRRVRRVPAPGWR